MQLHSMALIERPTHFVGSLIEARSVSLARRNWELPALLAILIVAAIVRFWGVGSYGLHKPDEDTTALPAVHILQDGTPRFPSGMFYARAIVQSYLIAGSAKVFGQSEWALRLPSVVAGLVVVLLSYFLGRRFLQPVWNMAFVAVVALLPAMIADSQEVRMYIFMSATLAAFMILVFRWERTGGVAVLGTAVLMMWFGIQFQEIAIFSSLLLLYPGLVHGDGRKVLQGLVALVITLLGYKVISNWTGSFYPEVVKDWLPNTPATLGEAPSTGNVRTFVPVVAAAALVAVALVWFNVRTVSTRATALAAGALLYLGLISQALLLYHIGAILLIAGLVVARRHGGARVSAMMLLVAACALLSAVHFLLLHAAGVNSFRKIIGAMIGQPSIWPYLQVAAYSPVAMLLVVAGIGVGLWQLAGGRKMGDEVLFAILAIVVPLFGIGFFGWYIPPRYGEFALLPMLLCALAFSQQLSRSVSGPLGVGLAALIAIVMVNPVALAHSVNPGASFLDHKQAAEFMRSIKPGPRDIVIAEEALLQTYYLGHVDYWLTGEVNSEGYVLAKQGRLVDEYTDALLLDTAAQFHALIDRTDRGNIYVIGSAEGGPEGRAWLRGPEISQVLQEPEFKTIYVAPDGQTKIWEIPAGTHSAAYGQ